MPDARLIALFEFMLPILMPSASTRDGLRATSFALQLPCRFYYFFVDITRVDHHAAATRVLRWLRPRNLTLFFAPACRAIPFAA